MENKLGFEVGDEVQVRPMKILAIDDDFTVQLSASVPGNVSNPWVGFADIVEIVRKAKDVHNDQQIIKFYHAEVSRLRAKLAEFEIEQERRK